MPQYLSITFFGMCGCEGHSFGQFGLLYVRVEGGGGGEEGGRGMWELHSQHRLYNPQ